MMLCEPDLVRDHDFSFMCLLVHMKYICTLNIGLWGGQVMDHPAVVSILPESICFGTRRYMYRRWASTLRADRTSNTKDMHPLIRSLKDRVAESEDADENTTELGHLLFDAALLESGFVPENAKGFTARVQVRDVCRLSLSASS
eukprot:1137595-Pelagomonas_calceolata.AAC.3